MLAELIRGEQHGYRLAQLFSPLGGRPWVLTRAQVYATLDALDDEGLVRSRAVGSPGRPTRRVFTITSRGQDEVRDWAVRSDPVLALRDELVVRATAATSRRTPEIIEAIRKRRDQLARRAAELERELSGLIESDQQTQLRRLALQHLLEVARSRVAWCAAVTSVLAHS